MSFWKKILGQDQSGLPPKQTRDPKRYESEKTIAKSDDVAARLKLAKNPKTHQEILYYLAENDPDPEVRRAVALNGTTPVQASTLLAQDKDIDVRLALAERLVKLLPHLGTDRQSQLYAFAVQALGTLAMDEVLKIRVALSSTLKDHGDTPAKVAGQLARDIEREVSEPILRYCAALDDKELLDILSGHPASWAVQAIAGRQIVSAPVSAAVIDTDDVPAGVILMGNNGADISLETLGQIVEKSKHVPQWQKPVAMRKNLPADLARELATFVDQSVRNILLDNTDLKAEDLEEISKIVRRRLDFMDEAGASTETLEQKVRRMAREGRLGDETIADALAVREKDFVVVALAQLAKTNRGTIENIVAMKAPKPLVAVAWRAGLSMRTALQLQKELANIPSKELLLPRGGTDYPMDDKELKWQLEFLGLAA